MFAPNNTNYFINALLQQGLSLKDIAFGARLSFETLELAYAKQVQLEGVCFNQLLGFYCAEIYAINLPQTTGLSPSTLSHQANALLDKLLQKPWQQHIKGLPKQMVVTNQCAKESYLTVREQQVLFYLLQDYSKAKSAANLGISARTIDYHWGRIRDRLQVFSLAQLAQEWQPKG